mgnify:CR=1 FL=1
MCNPASLETTIQIILKISGMVLIVAGTILTCYSIWRIIRS